jgi:serine/threonine protein phosphatase PrpC
MVKTTDATGKMSCATEKGIKIYQEDCYLTYSFILPNGFGGTVLAVMDGHLGVMVAEICKQYIPRFFVPESEDEVYVAFKKLMSELNERTQNMNCGTTLSAVFIPKGDRAAYVSILGDSPVIIIDRECKTNVNIGHNVNKSTKERLAAEARGGKYRNKYMWSPDTGYMQGLQLSRALGDKWMGKILSREPEIHFVPIGPKSIIMVASDGILTGKKEYENSAVDIISEQLQSGADASELMAHIVDSNEGILYDNTTIVTRKGVGCENA